MRTELNKMFSDIHFSDEEKHDMTERLMAASFSQERKGNTMKMKKWQKVATIAAGILVIGGTVGAAGRQAIIYSWSNSFPDYRSAERISEEAEKLGLPEFPAAFECGFEFEDGNIEHARGEDDAGNSTGSWEELMASYKAADGRTVNLNVTDNYTEDSRTPTDSRDIDGVTVRYNVDEYLFLPPDSEGNVPEYIAEREESDDHFYVSFGSEEPETTYYKGVSFERDGVHYYLFSTDDVSEDEFMDMAEELIRG